MDIVGVDQGFARAQGAGERTIIILVDQGDPILHESAEDPHEWCVSGFVGEALQLRAVRDVCSQHMCMELREHDTHRVQVSQIEPLNKYQVISRSRRAYSERSRAEDGLGTRRRLSARSSSASAVIKGLLSFLPEDNITAE